jgi:Mn2+/Fe2+ NRAMP family transporter
LKRILSGIGWFFIFYFGILFVLGAIAGAVATYQNHVTNFQEASQIGYEAGKAIAEKSARLIFFISLLISAIGSATGKLPGTKKAKKSN